MGGDWNSPGTNCVCTLDLGHAHHSWMWNSLDESLLVIFADAVSNADHCECLFLHPFILSSLAILEFLYLPLTILALPPFLFSTTTQTIGTVRWHGAATSVELHLALCLV